MSKQQKKAPGSGKLANDHNRQGAQAATQTHESQRTPESRHDRETQVGSHNVQEARTGGTGGKGAGRGGKRGAG